jgi:predicted HicB family RNase H-like nuclease
MSSKYQEVLQVAQELFSQNPDWVTFFREVLGLEGAVRKAFPTPEELGEFERTAEYQKIQAMVAKLREVSGSRPTAQEPTTVITVRLPKSLHDSLRAEAHECRTSMNKLCIAKLLQMLDEEPTAPATPATPAQAVPGQTTQPQRQDAFAPQHATTSY